MSIEAEEQGGGGGAPEWMVTYSDMVTLLLCFFVLLYAMSQVDVQKMIGLRNSMADTFNPRSLLVNPTATGPVEDPNVVGSSGVLENPYLAQPIMPGGSRGVGNGGTTRLEEDLKEMQREVQQIAKKLGLEEQLSAELNDRGLVISFAETARSLTNVSPFESGSAQLSEPFKRVLAALASVLRRCPNKIEVQGHTDRRPIYTPAFPSNWELSGARAGAVVRYFVEGHALRADQFVCTGFADTVPVDRRDNPDGWARNRRVEICVTRRPIEAYDQLTRAQAMENPVDITAPVGRELVPTNLPAGR